MTEPFTPVPSALTCATFTPLVGESFTATRDGVSVALELIEANVTQLKPIDGRSRGKAGFVRRDPFALLFRGPAAPPLQQGLHHFAHPALGELQIFVVPVGPGESGLLYEAVFN